MPVEFSQLGPMTKIAAGGVGTVYRLTSFSLPGTGPLAYKDVHPVGPSLSDQARKEAIRSMEKAVALRAAMSPADQGALDEYTTWPIEMVEDGGTTVGLIMPLLEDDFFATAKPAGGPPVRKVFEFAFLSTSDNYMKNLGMDRTPMNDPLVRLSLTAQLAFVIGLLHKHGIVYGDLSLKNVAAAANPPRVKLLDCDAAAAVADTSRKQMNSPGFKPPECANNSQSLQDPTTDVYKLGLCVLRSLVTGPGVTQLTSAQPLADNNTLDAAGVDLVRRAIGPVRAARPTAKELCVHLGQTVRAQAKPPQIHSVAVSRAALPRGTDLIVTWSVDGATSLRILGPNGLVIDIDKPDGHPRGYTITPVVSGEFWIEATNRYGTEDRSAGQVLLFDLPPVDYPALPRPQVPAVPAVRVPAAMAAVPRPVVTTATHPVPRLAAPDISRLLAEVGPVLPSEAFLSPGRRTAQHMRAAQHEASAEIAGLITASLASITATVRQATTKATTKTGGTQP